MKSGLSWSQRTHRNSRKGRSNLVLNPVLVAVSLLVLLSSTHFYSQPTVPEDDTTYLLAQLKLRDKADYQDVPKGQKTGRESPDTLLYKHSFAER